MDWSHLLMRCSSKSNSKSWAMQRYARGKPAPCSAAALASLIPGTLPTNLLPRAALENTLRWGRERRRMRAAGARRAPGCSALNRAQARGQDPRQRTIPPAPHLGQRRAPM